MNKVVRCPWVENQPEICIKYHDEQWGVPVHDDRLLFQKLILDGAQAGLSWLTILKKRENYIKAFDGFDVKKVAAYNEDKIQELLNNPGIVRNKLKIRSAVRNAGVFLKIQEEFGSFDNYIWKFTDYRVVNCKYKKASEIPTKNNISEKISDDLKNRGMNFVGSTIIYAYIQAIGLLNDHTTNCFRYKELIK